MKIVIKTAFLLTFAFLLPFQSLLFAQGGRVTSFYGAEEKAGEPLKSREIKEWERQKKQLRDISNTLQQILTLKDREIESLKEKISSLEADLSKKETTEPSEAQEPGEEAVLSADRDKAKAVSQLKERLKQASRRERRLLKQLKDAQKEIVAASKKAGTAPSGKGKDEKDDVIIDLAGRVEAVSAKKDILAAKLRDAENRIFNLRERLRFQPKLEKKINTLERKLAAQKKITAKLDKTIKYLARRNDLLKEKLNYPEGTFKVSTEEEIETLKERIFFLAKSPTEQEKENNRLREEIKKLNDERYPLYERLGNAYTKLKLYAEAIKAYKTAVSLNPYNAEAHYYLGLLHQYTEDDTAAAIEQLQRYIDLSSQGEHKEKAKKLIEILKKK